MIFEEMKLKQRKEEFLCRKCEAIECDMNEFQSMENYLLSEHFDRDMDRLIRGDYYFDLPRLIFLRKGQSNRRRKVYSFSQENKMLLQYLAYMLLERYDDRLPDTLYSFRRKKPIHQLYSMIREVDPKRERYVVKADIRSFGESMDTDRLKGIMEEWLRDEPEVCSFILWLITRNRYIRDGKEEEGVTSVLPGNPVVPFLQNIFLQDVDRFMQENSLLCSRYSDDICMLCEDRDKAEENMAKLVEMLHALNLEINEEKTMVIPPGEDFDLMGIKFAPDYLDLADNTYSKARARLKHRADRLLRKVRRGEISGKEGAGRMAVFINQYFYGREDQDELSFAEHFFPYITSVERLKRLDHLNQDWLRVLATGRHTNAKYRFRYADIQRLDYVPLVYAYYHRGSIR